MNLNDLDTFIHVAEAGTFASAARRLGVPKSTVSRRIARLEDALGVALLKRSARSFALTDDGRALHTRCAPALREIAEAERGLGDEVSLPRGRLAVTTSIDMGATPFLAGLLADYATRYEQVRVALRVNNRAVDLLEEGVDLAFRVHSTALPDRDDLMARRLGQLTFSLYASPAYVARRGIPDSMEALAEHATVSHTSALRERWPVPPSLTANDFGPVAAMLAAGAGIGGLPDFVAGPHLASGALIRLPLAWPGPRSNLTLLWLRSRHLAPRVRAFIDLAAAHAATADWLLS